MHCSAKRGIATACRLSVCPFVTLVDHNHIGWKSWKLIARTISPTHSLFVAQRPSTYLLPGEHEEIWGRLQVRWEKVACWSTKVAISPKRVKIEEKLLWRAYRNSPTFFVWYHPRPLHLLGVRNFSPKMQSLLVRLRTSNVAHSQGPSEQKPIKNFGEKGAWAYLGTAQFFDAPYYLRNG